MSFLSERKDEIIQHQYKNQCCKRALLYGILFAKAEASYGVISLNAENLKIGEYISELVKDLYNKPSEITVPPGGGRCVMISFEANGCEKYLNSISDGAESFFISKCSSCKASFIRGLFLSCGRIVNPEKQYRLELSPHFNSEKIIEYLRSEGLNFSFKKRNKENIIYTGNSTVIEDFFTLAGMNSTTFLLMNSKIKSDLKNTANRIRNCETNNIIKSVSASAKFIVAIEALEKAKLLSTLPEALEKTARLRLKFRDYSLSRLAAEFTPPISKPGLSHRLNKILDIYNSLMESKEKT